MAATIYVAMIPNSVDAWTRLLSTQTTFEQSDWITTYFAGWHIGFLKMLEELRRDVSMRDRKV